MRHDASQRSAKCRIPLLRIHRPKVRAQELKEVAAIDAKEWQHLATRYRRIRQSDPGVLGIFENCGSDRSVGARSVKRHHHDPIERAIGLPSCEIIPDDIDIGWSEKALEFHLSGLDR
jgi:hypothetical protein